MTAAGPAREALRQQMLLRALWRDAPPAVVAGWLRDGAHTTRGIQAYQANAAALAGRALEAAFPTLQALLGAESFATMARVFWHAQPPVQGDIAEWGAALPAFLADDQQLAGEPYLPDVARLEWAVHGAERAPDALPPQGLELLATHDPALLWLRLQPGTALVRSAHPVASIWHAHRSQAADRFAGVRAAFAAGTGEDALVLRDGWKAAVQALPADSAAFHAALLAGQPLARALDAAGPAFAFEPWLLAALQGALLAAVTLEP